jgi:hypothetical protein
MKDQDSMRRKFEVLERRIRRLQQFERELKSLNIAGFESEATALQAKLKDPSKIDEVEIEITALKNKINERKRKEQTRKHAQNAIEIVTAKLKEAEQLGIPKIHSTLSASAAFDIGDYDTAIQLAHRAKEEIERSIIRYKDASTQIDKSQSAIEKIEDFGAPVEKADELIQQAHSELKKGNYDRAIAIAKQAEEEAVRVKRDYEVYKETSDVISEVEAEVARIKRSDVKTSKSDELIEQARSELNAGNYDRAVAIAKRAEEEAVKVKKDYEIYKETADGISSIEARIAQLQSSSVATPKSEALMEQAQSELKTGNYVLALERAKQAEEEAVRVKEDHEVYTETTEIISSIEAELAEIKKYGVKLPKSGELLEQAKAELTKHNFDRVREIAEEAKRAASERKSAYERASRSTSETEKKLTELQDKGVIISSELLTKN